MTARTALFVCAAAALGCGTGDASKDEATEASAAEAKPGKPGTVHGPNTAHQLDAHLPDAVPVLPLGEVTPAPWLEGAQRVAVLGDGKRKIVLSARLGAVEAHLPDGTKVASAEAVGQGQVLEIVDIHGDARPEIAVGYGFGRGALDAPPSLRIFPVPVQGKPWKPIAEIPLPETTRAQLVAMVPELGRPGAFTVGMFTSKYQVAVLSVARQPDGSFQVTTRDTIRVALSFASADIDADGKGELVVARPYGETVDALCDVFVLRDDNSRAPLPSTRGARAVTTWRGAVIYADGWHKNYGRRARALITRTWRVGDKWRSQVLVRVQNRFGYDRLRIGDINGDGKADIIAAGNGPAVAVLGMSPAKGGIPGLGAVDAVDAFPFDLDDDGREEVILAGPKPGIWRNGPRRSLPAVRARGGVRPHDK